MKSLRHAFLLSLVVLLIASCTGLPSLAPSPTQSGQPAEARGAAEPATAEPPIATTAPTAASAPAPVEAAPVVTATAAVTVTAPLTATGAAGSPTPGPAQVAGASALVNVVWEWAALLKTNPATQSVIPDPSVYAVMFSDNGELMIKADCNVARGTYTVANDQLTIVLGATTKEACQPGSLSASMLDSLGKVASYTIDDGDLILRVKDTGDSLVFRNGGPVVPPAPPPVTASGTAAAPTAARPSAPREMTPTPAPVTAAAATAAPATAAPARAATDLQLVGTTWQWEKLVDVATGKNSLNVKTPGNYTVTFTPDGKAVMKADCNQVSGTYKVDGIKLTVEVGPITVSPCATGSLTGAFLVDLTSAATFKIENGKLNVDLMADGGRMVFGAK